MGKSIQLAAPEAGRRRRYTPEQKRTLLDEAARPGASISSVARNYGIAPSVMFLWKRTMDDAGEEGLKANEKVVPESEVKKLEARIKELERALGRKSMQVEILEEALKLTEKKKAELARKLVQEGRWSMKGVSEALGVSRSHLSESLRRAPRARGATRCPVTRSSSSAFGRWLAPAEAHRPRRKAARRQSDHLGQQPEVVLR